MVIGSMGYNPKEYPMKINRWNSPLILALTLDPNFQRDIQVSLVINGVFLGAKKTHLWS